MTRSLAVLWTSGDELHTGRLDSSSDSLELRGRRQALSIPLGSIKRCLIDRAPSVRLRGLPVLRLELVSGAVVRISSLESVTALTDLVERLARPKAV